MELHASNDLCTRVSEKLSSQRLSLCEAATFRHSFSKQSFTYIDMHLSIEAIVDNKLMCHLYSKWFHWMFLAIEVGTDLGVVEIRDPVCRHVFR